MGEHPNPLSHTGTMALGEARLDLKGDGAVNTTNKPLASICHRMPSHPRLQGTCGPRGWYLQWQSSCHHTTRSPSPPPGLSPRCVQAQL